VAVPNEGPLGVVITYDKTAKFAPNKLSFVLKPFGQPKTVVFSEPGRAEVWFATRKEALAVLAQTGKLQVDVHVLEMEPAKPKANPGGGRVSSSSKKSAPRPPTPTANAKNAKSAAATKPTSRPANGV
jgi:hypothetical protein